VYGVDHRAGRCCFGFEFASLLISLLSACSANTAMHCEVSFLIVVLWLPDGVSREDALVLASELASTFRGVRGG